MCLGVLPNEKSFGLGDDETEAYTRHIYNGKSWYHESGFYGHQLGESW